MATRKRKLPDHLYPNLELAEENAARISSAMREIHVVMNDPRGINKHMLEKLHAQIEAAVANITMALSLIERREPVSGNNGHGPDPAIDRNWLAAMDRLARLPSGEGTLEAIRAFIGAKMVELDQS